jgi:filamentous hemagglutinin
MNRQIKGRPKQLHGMPMAQGLNYEAAHTAALAKYGVSPFDLYAPEVIETKP